MKNIFDGLPSGTAGEVFETLVERAGVCVERIVSHGEASEDGFWYDQPHEEWVIVLRGAARVRFEQDDRVVELAAGDFLDIPAQTRHRVDWTTPDEATVWLAVHWGEEPQMHTDERK